MVPELKEKLSSLSLVLRKFKRVEALFQLRRIWDKARVLFTVGREASVQPVPDASFAKGVSTRKPSKVAHQYRISTNAATVDVHPELAEPFQANLATRVLLYGV